MLISIFLAVEDTLEVAEYDLHRDLQDAATALIRGRCRPGMIQVTSYMVHNLLAVIYIMLAIRDHDRNTREEYYSPPRTISPSPRYDRDLKSPKRSVSPDAKDRHSSRSRSYRLVSFGVWKLKESRLLPFAGLGVELMIDCFSM
ncbi:hypothetical protein AXF42_Ash000768 [Apostasia shenzhenica]|uniref:Uncharacterized protein n=1 Tax=Apostasia shenzhenica TaxID=1088818 RepID=A0A2I0AHA6_9ASPA|nr:hypothetical protein AXF42_Ash000768 [Apostasia shenzhenica]